MKRECILANARSTAACSTPRCYCAYMWIRRNNLNEWVQEQQKPALLVMQQSEGRQIFETTACVNCHAISGTVADGRFGPDLTHLMSRDTIASGAAPNTPENLQTVDSRIPTRSSQAR